MKQKIIVCGLSIALLLAQNLFVFSQVSNGNLQTNDEIINLFDDPDALAVVQVRKILSETAPALLGSRPETLDKIRAAMKSIEDDSGINPYALEKIYIGMKPHKASETLMVVLQTNEPAGALVEKIFQTQTAKAKFAPEINPLKNRIDSMERGIKPLKENVIPQNQPSAEDLAKLDEYEIAIGQLKPSKAQQAGYNKLQADFAEMKKLFAQYQTLQTSVYNLGDLPERLDAVKKQVEAISAGDPQRKEKIAAADKLLIPIEKELDEKRNRMVSVDESKAFASFSTDGMPFIPENLQTDAEAESKFYFELPPFVTERIESLKMLIETMSAKTVPPNSRLKEMDAEGAKYILYPLSETVTRKDETVGGKKLTIIRTVKNYPKESETVLPPKEDAFLVYDDKTLVFGEKAVIAKTVEAKAADANRVAKNMIARSTDSLVAFGVNFRNLDMGEFAAAFGEQKNAWQVVGSLDSTGNDFSLSAALEKTEFPQIVKATKKEIELPISKNDIPGGGDFDSLFKSMLNSMVGLEAKVTVRFDKQKTAAFVEKTPEFLSRILKR